MPYKLQWVPTPTNEDLEVLDKMPENIDLEGYVLDNEGKFVYGNDGKRISYYYCEWCEGWILGHPNRYKEDTLAPLAGRRGTVESCIKCGNEIDFFGVVS